MGERHLHLHVVEPTVPWTAGLRLSCQRTFLTARMHADVFAEPCKGPSRSIHRQGFWCSN